jgi:hypothetical protein
MRISRGVFKEIDEENQEDEWHYEPKDCNEDGTFDLENVQAPCFTKTVEVKCGFLVSILRSRRSRRRHTASDTRDITVASFNVSIGARESTSYIKWSHAKALLPIVRAPAVTHNEDRDINEVTDRGSSCDIAVSSTFPFDDFCEAKYFEVDDLSGVFVDAFDALEAFGQVADGLLEDSSNLEKQLMDTDTEDDFYSLPLDGERYKADEAQLLPICEELKRSVRATTESVWKW